MRKLKRINARIGTDLDRLVQELARGQGLSTSEIVVRALQEFCAGASQQSGLSAYDKFSKAGLIGCFKGGKNLSQRYKEQYSKAVLEKWPGK